MNLKTINKPFTQIPQCTPTHLPSKQPPSTFPYQSITNQNITLNLYGNFDYKHLIQKINATKTSSSPSSSSQLTKQTRYNKCYSFGSRSAMTQKLHKTRNLFNISPPPHTKHNILNVIREESLSIEGNSKFSSKVQTNSTYLLLKESKCIINNDNNVLTNTNESNKCYTQGNSDIKKDTKQFHMESHFQIELLGNVTHKDEDEDDVKFSPITFNFNRANTQVNRDCYKDNTNNTIKHIHIQQCLQPLTNKKYSNNNISTSCNNNNNISTNREHHGVTVNVKGGKGMKSKSNSNNNHHVHSHSHCNLLMNGSNVKRKKRKKNSCCLPLH